MLDIAKIRSQFPILTKEIYHKPLIYLDNAATSQHPQCVIESITDSYYRVNANVHRGVHTLSIEATEAHEEARRRVQQYINARSAHEVIFTRGTTEAINLVAGSWGDEFLHDGDEVILSIMEHHSNIVPWQLLQRHKAIKLRVIPMNEQGELDLEAYRAAFNEHTRLVSITHASNVLGTINPIEEIVAYAHERNVPVLVDGAQAIPHLTVDVQALDADFYVFSAHKVYGPTGIGILYGKEKWLDAMPPYQGGGEMIAHVSFEQTTYNELPYKFEAGTPDYIGSRAFATALYQDIWYGTPKDTRNIVSCRPHTPLRHGNAARQDGSCRTYRTSLRTTVDGGIRHRRDRACLLCCIQYTRRNRCLCSRSNPMLQHAAIASRGRRGSSRAHTENKKKANELYYKQFFT